MHFLWHFSNFNDPLNFSFLTLSLRVTSDIHLNIYISATSSSFSSGLFMGSCFQGIAGLTFALWTLIREYCWSLCDLWRSLMPVSLIRCFVYAFGPSKFINFCFSPNTSTHASANPISSCIPFSSSYRWFCPISLLHLLHLFPLLVDLLSQLSFQPFYFRFIVEWHRFCRMLHTSQEYVHFPYMVSFLQ